MHSMNEIQQTGATPVTAAQALRTGAMAKAAGTIFGAFVKSAENHRTRAIYSLVTEGFTVAEYEEIERQALMLAKAADDASGFQAPADAKGRAKYGPKQSTCASRASERKAVFGVMRLHMAALVSIPPSGIVQPDMLPNWELATQQARKYLHGAKLNWQGEHTEALTGRRQLQIERKASAEALEEVQRQNPQQAGETIEQYLQRITPLVAAQATDKKQAQQAKAVDDLTAQLIKDHGLQFCVMVADSIKRAAALVDGMAAHGGDPINPAPGTPDAAPAKVAETAEA